MPDNEFVRFLAMATFGKFLYAADCKYLESQTNDAGPNFYHWQLLLREISLSKPVVENMWRSVHGGNTERPVDLPRPKLMNIQPEHVVADDTRFPWDQQSKPPVVNMVSALVVVMAGVVRIQGLLFGGQSG